jgi:hypothetical protein
VSQIGFRQSGPQQTDELIHAGLAQAGGSRDADPLNLGVVLRALRQQRPVRRKHLAPVAVRVDFRHRPDHQIGVLARQIDDGTVRFRHRRDCGHGEDHRGRSMGRIQFV